MGKVFVEEAMQVSRIGRVEMVSYIAYLIRSKRASGQADALKRIEAGEFDYNDIREEIIRSYQVELPEENIVQKEQD